MTTALARTPVLIGIGAIMQREEDALRALEPLDLMMAAVASAGRDCGVAQALADLDHIAVPRGRWKYRDPARAIAARCGAHGATTVLASVGVLQQNLIGEACDRIARGSAQTTLVAGADAGYRLLRAQIAGQTLSEREQTTDPDQRLEPKEELFHPVETRAGFAMPVGLYAIMESAWRASQGWSVAEHRDRLAALYAGFSAVAAANPHAWQRSIVDAAAIRAASARNPMQAFPYTRWHCASWNVDQASALLFCSAARAQALGIPHSRWIFPIASTESNHMVPVSARADLSACVGAKLAGRAALAAADLSAHELDFIELYSCFPIAVTSYAAALGIAPSRTLTITGGMPFAGGPFNNYVFHATCRAAELLRARGRGTALVSSVSGMLTKQGFGLWSATAPARGFVRADVSSEVARELRTCPVIERYSGPATVAGYTVLHGRSQTPRGVALVDTPAGARVLSTTRDNEMIANMQVEEWVGREVQVVEDQLV